MPAKNCCWRDQIRLPHVPSLGGLSGEIRCTRSVRQWSLTVRVASWPCAINLTSFFHFPNFGRYGKRQSPCVGGECSHQQEAGSETRNGGDQVKAGQNVFVVLSHRFEVCSDDRERQIVM